MTVTSVTPAIADANRGVVASLLDDALIEENYTKFLAARDGIDIECTGMSVRVAAANPDAGALYVNEIPVPAAAAPLCDIAADCLVVRRENMADSGRVFGPALIKDVGTTIVVPAAFVASCDNQGNIVLDAAENAADEVTV